jgi:hypothetical protein
VYGILEEAFREQYLVDRVLVYHFLRYRNREGGLAVIAQTSLNFYILFSYFLLFPPL